MDIFIAEIVGADDPACPQIYAFYRADRVVRPYRLKINLIIQTTIYLNNLITKKHL
jgi:hypothetical protein